MLNILTWIHKHIVCDVTCRGRDVINPGGDFICRESDVMNTVGVMSYSGCHVVYNGYDVVNYSGCDRQKYSWCDIINTVEVMTQIQWTRCQIYCV